MQQAAGCPASAPHRSARPGHTSTHSLQYIHGLVLYRLQAKNDQTELEELREMKSDIERKEKQQASIIENQAKRLDELEKLYKDEQV